MDDQKEQDRIRRRAYEIWEREGSPEGRAEEFWQKAIESLDAEDPQGVGESASSQSERESEDKDK